MIFSALKMPFGKGKDKLKTKITLGLLAKLFLL